MVLSGTLRDFILADVFQLLAQQKITGKLVLTSGKSEGCVVFKDGLIASAERFEECFEDKLHNYLIDYKQIAADKVRALFSAHKENCSGLVKDVINHGYASSEEMKSFSEAIIEDISCSLFLLRSGTYRFNSLRTVDPFIPGIVAIASENIVMEAMRRVDEWNRMKEYIESSSVFTRTTDSPRKGNANPWQETQEYIYCFVNGTSTVENIIAKTCLSEYRVFEALNELVKANRVTRISPMSQPTFQASHNQQNKQTVSVKTQIIMSVMATLGTVMMILFLGLVVYNYMLFPKLRSASLEARSQVVSSLAEQKIEIATLQYRALVGKQPQTYGDLKRAGLIGTKDLITIEKWRSHVASQKNQMYTSE